VVRYKGKPVTGGVLQLWGENKDGNESAQGGINGDGIYPRKTDVQVTVQKGSQTQDIDLP
jgi:hypothetical protein